MKTVEILFHPGDTIEYKSRRYSKATMVIEKVKVNWTAYAPLVIKYIGRPMYEDSGQKQYWTKVAVSDLSIITLLTEGKRQDRWIPYGQ